MSNMSPSDNIHSRRHASKPAGWTRAIESPSSPRDDRPPPGSLSWTLRKYAAIVAVLSALCLFLVSSSHLLSYSSDAATAETAETASKKALFENYVIQEGAAALSVPNPGAPSPPASSDPAEKAVDAVAADFAAHTAVQTHDPPRGDASLPVPSKQKQKADEPELNCRASVLSFLVNATDIRDECDGLHGAFASSCVEEAPADASPLAETHRFLAAKKDPGHVIVTRQDRKRLRQQRNARKRQKQHDLECCRSVVRVYHERCDDRTAEDLTDRNLLVIVLVLCLCGFVRSAIRRFEVHCLPEVAGCILVGVAGGILVHLVPGYSFSFDEHLFLRVLLPPIVFEATLSIDKRAFRRHVVPILGYAILGTIFSSGLVAIILRTEGTLPWVDSLAFGTLISSIDPVATLAVLNAIGIDETETLYILIFGEALLNDGVAVVLFENLVSFMDDSVTVDSNIILHAVLDFFKVALGSCLVGVIAGIFCTLYFRAVKGWQTPLIEVLLFFLWSLIPYYVCDEIKWSGIVSIVVMGFIMDMYVIGSEAKDFSLPHSLRHARPLLYSRGCLSETGTRHVRFVVEVISTLMETTIFAYLGLFMFSSRFHWDLTLVLLACLGCILSRGVMVLLLTSLLNGAEACRHHLAVRTAPPGDADASLAERRQRLVIDRRTQAVLFYSGLRGAMSFALVENIPLYDVVTGRGSRYKPELKAMTSSAIFVTIFLFGGSTFHLLQRLGFAGREREGRLGEEEAAAKVHRSMEEE